MAAIDPSRPPSPAAPSTYDVLMALLLALSWLVPMAVTGVSNRAVPHFPRYLQNLHRCACLFTKRTPTWTTSYLQIEPAGSGTWVELSEDGYFDMPAFGYRTRLDRIVGHSAGVRAGGEARLLELAQFVRTRWSELHPGEPALGALRFSWAATSVDELRREPGRYQKPPLATLAPGHIRQTVEVRFTAKGPLIARDAGERP